MALDALLARLEGRSATSATSDATRDVQPKPAPIGARTSATSATSQNSIPAGRAPEAAKARPAQATQRAPARRESLRPDPHSAEAEGRRQQALAMLERNPALRLAVVSNSWDDPVKLAVAIRDKGTVEVHIPASTFNPFKLLELVARHGGTLH